MRPTNIEIETPIGGHKVVIKGYVTGGDEQDIKGIIAKGVHYEFQENSDGTVTQKPILEGFSMVESNNKAVEVMVLSVDGSSADVVKAVLDMDRRDTAFVMAEVNRVTRDSGLSEEKKSELPSNPSSLPATDQVT